MSLEQLVTWLATATPKHAAAMVVDYLDHLGMTPAGSRHGQVVNMFAAVEYLGFIHIDHNGMVTIAVQESTR